MKNIGILGSTGSIGTQTLQVIDEFPEQYRVILLAGYGNWELMIKQAKQYSPKYIVLTKREGYEAFQKHWDGDGTTVLLGMDNLLTVLEQEPLDMVIGAMGGAAGIAPTLRALELGINIGLANKETIVAAGDLVKKAQAKTGAKILPVDSEHSAIFQCMEEGSKCLERILLTASGGPFREATLETLQQVKPEHALKHPNWSMGRKITIDSATLMNKGLEVIEANWLFGVPYDKIKVLVHPQSIIHSMVEYGDGSILAHLGMADMRIPIQYALTYPNRAKNTFPKLDLTAVQGLTFHEPDYEKFLALSLAFEAGRMGKSMPAVLNAANEVAVEAFLNQQISFLEIPRLVERVMTQHNVEEIVALEQLMNIDHWARKQAQQIIQAK